ncbi:MAG: DUF3291 domain-containing protein [Pseudomonadales bacterium]|nr:DUF3291 domain-containing protein [Pseudomonadales bacterium]
MSQYHLAQLNIATMLAPIDSPELADFVANLDRINAAAESAPGYVWRLQSDDGDATAFRPFGDDILVNLSVWEDVEALHDYVYRSDHAKIMSRRKDWFEMMRQASVVLWWLPVKELPTLEQAKEKLELLHANGPSATAFTFKQSFPAPS